MGPVLNGSVPVHEETSHINATYSYTPGDYNLPQDNLEQENHTNTETRGHHSRTYQVWNWHIVDQSIKKIFDPYRKTNTFPKSNLLCK